MIKQASELHARVKAKEVGTEWQNFSAYVSDVDYDVARRRVEIALHRLGYDASGFSSDGFKQIHLTNWLRYREERLGFAGLSLPDQFELRNMLTAGDIFFVGLPGTNETYQYAQD